MKEANSLFDKLLNDTEIIFNIDFLQNRDKYSHLANKIIYSGKIDEYFNYTDTQLEYRTVRWDYAVKETNNYQGTPVINYPDLNITYIRAIEYKHFEPYNKEVQENNKIIIG